MTTKITLNKIGYIADECLAPYNIKLFYDILNFRVNISILINLTNKIIFLVFQVIFS